MARRHFWQFLVTDEGVPIENANIYVYKAGTMETVYVFAGEVAGGTDVLPQTRTTQKGYFEFWIGDESEGIGRGYSLSQKFKIAWDAVGVSSGYIDFVDIFSTGIYEVETSDLSQAKNKAVSNFLANGWENHKNLNILYDSDVHGIQAVDILDEDGDSTLTPMPNPPPTYTLFNKMISNKLGRNWTDHTASWYDPTLVIGGNAVVVNDSIQHDMAPNVITDGPHGIQMVDEEDNITTNKNKLVSNQQAFRWTKVYNDLEVDFAYSRVDGTIDYTDPIGYDGTVNYIDLSADSFISKSHLQNLELTVLTTEAQGVGSWEDVSGNFVWTITHNKGVIYPAVVTVYEIVDLNVKEIVVPLGITHVDSNIVQIVMPTPMALCISLKWFF